MCLCATGNHFCEVSCAFVSHYDQRFTKVKHVTQFIIFALRFLSFSVTQLDAVKTYSHFIPPSEGETQLLAFI